METIIYGLISLLIDISLGIWLYKEKYYKTSNFCWFVAGINFVIFLKNFFK